MGGQLLWTASVTATVEVESPVSIAHTNQRCLFMKACNLNYFVRSIAFAVLVPALAFAQPRSDSDMIKEVALSTLAKAIGQRAAGEALVFWADSASERNRLASATGVSQASPAQLACHEKSCREPADGVRVLVVASPPTVRGGSATVVMEELRGMRTRANTRWTDVTVHTVNLEKKRGVWTVTTGSTSVPGSRRP